MTYVQSHFCNSMIDPDIYLLQVRVMHYVFCILANLRAVTTRLDHTSAQVFICMFLTTQVCASRLDPDYFISSVFER